MVKSWMGWSKGWLSHEWDEERDCWIMNEIDY